jgi:PhzF family phenazine biosynthesis protein
MSSSSNLNLDSATPIWQVDAFTSTPFSGNPAGVCVLAEARSAEWMQNVALEMALSETAFLQAMDDGWSLRWFTPATEVKLCGHATLASAHILWSEGLVAPEQAISFHTLSGVLTATRQDQLIELDFPARPPQPVAPPPGLSEALAVTPELVARDQEDYLVLVADEDTVRHLAPDIRGLAGVEARGIIVTAAAEDPAHDFVSRFFAPAVGVDEDPVTGSAHCCLAPFWGERLGKTEMAGYQASARGGTVRVCLAGDRVVLGGHAVTTLRGSLLV